jgi:hypothetical protein
MKRLCLLIWLSILPIGVQAQQPMDQELESLLAAVCRLRSADAATYELVHNQLAGDSAWTPMNETGSLQEGECRPSVKIPRFGLNKMLTQIGSERKYVAERGDMLNGADERYNYSLFERSIHAGQSASYKLQGREGRQWFVIVPMSAKAPLSASLQIAGEEPRTFERRKDGTLVLWLDTPGLNREQTLTLSVSGSQADQAFVILNHNTRER